jgi:hypothetical protein
MTTEGLSILPWPRKYNAHYVLADRPRRETTFSSSQYTVGRPVIELTVTVAAVAVLQKILIDWCSTLP